MSVIPHLLPRCFDDLVVEVSLIRPGPLQGNMVRPYLRRRKGEEAVTYPHPSLERTLRETLGVLVFQEQVIKIARDFAGFTAGRGELLRRALGNKNAGEALEKFRVEFVAGAIERGASLRTAEQVWGMIAGFAGYSFSKAHAAAFAVIVYWSAWLRVHYPTEYFCGLLRNAPLGTYPPNVLESEARRAGVKFLSFDINRSWAKAMVQEGAIRFGLSYVKGVSDERADALVQVRGKRPFRSLADFIERVKPERRMMEWLILAGAFDQFGERRQVLWDLAEAFDIARRPKGLPIEIPDERARMRPMAEDEKLTLTFAATGVTAGMNLVESRRDAFTKAGCLRYAQLRKMRPGAKVKVGGLVADGVRRPPTAKGTAFMRLVIWTNDVKPGSFEMGDVVIPPQVYVACRDALHSSAFFIVEGKLERLTPTLQLLATKVSSLP